MWATKKRDINPLTTTQFMKPLYNTTTVMPVSQANYSDLPFNSIDNNEIDFSHNTNNNFNDNKTIDDALINDDIYDHGELGNADPDSNFLVNNRQAICASIPRNLNKLKLHLDNLNHTFSIIAISESWLTSTNKDLYHMKGYTHKYKIREHRAGGGVSLFINNNIRYEIRSDIKFNVDDVNAPFI